MGFKEEGYVKFGISGNWSVCCLLCLLCCLSLVIDLTTRFFVRAAFDFLFKDPFSYW